MRRILAALPVIAALLTGSSALAGDLTVNEPFARATAANARAGAAFLTISSPTADVLLSGRSPVAQTVELHTHLMDNGVVRMRAVASIPVEPGKPATLKPGGDHIMLMGLTGPLVEGTSFPLTLRFEKAGEITIQVPVAAAGAAAPTSGAHHGH
jgi:periplasmic copper chaperone A